MDSAALTTPVASLRLIPGFLLCTTWASWSGVSPALRSAQMRCPLDQSVLVPGEADLVDLGEVSVIVGAATPVLTVNAAATAIAGTLSAQSVRAENMSAPFEVGQVRRPIMLFATRECIAIE